jgi:alkaline phosphatase
LVCSADAPRRLGPDKRRSFRKTRANCVNARSCTERIQAGAADIRTRASGGIALKYVFLFIGDGMSYPQFQAAADYLARWRMTTMGFWMVPNRCLL